MTKSAALIAIAFAASLFGTAESFAQERGARSHAGNARASHGQQRGPSYNRGDRHHHGGRGWSGPRYYYPYAAYGAPVYVTPYFAAPIYEAAPPVYLERYYVEEAPPIRQAQIVPLPAEPRRAPEPRFERVTLSAQELFGFDQATLRSPQPKLDEIAALLVRNPQIGNVRVIGYTDRIGTDSYNMKLSQRRADAVKTYLVAKGVAADRVVAIGKGEADPVVKCNDKAMADLIKCLEPNRRVEVERITIERRVS